MNERGKNCEFDCKQIFVYLPKQLPRLFRRGKEDFTLRAVNTISGNTKDKEGIAIVMWKEFKAFAFKGNVIDMAVGVMIGSAFSKIVTSLVNDIFMPLLSVLTGKIDFSTLYISLDGKEYASYQAAVDANAAMFRYGSFLQSVLDFLLISICIFAFVKLVSCLHKKPEAPPPAPARKCPYCYGEIDEHATRCPHCTSELPPAERIEKA